MKDAELGVYDVCPTCGHDPAKSVRVVHDLRVDIYLLRKKIDTIRNEVIRQWNKIDPKWLMEELDR